MAAEGLSDREIGERLGLTKNAVQIIRKRKGIEPGKVITVPAGVIETIRNMATSGSPDGEIGKAVGMSKESVWAVRNRNRIEAGRKPEYHRHGTPSMYNSGCRCGSCRGTQAKRAENRRARRDELLEARDGQIDHGVSGYTNWGCRCDTCKEEHLARVREYHDASQAQTLPLAKNHGKQWTGPELELAGRDDLTATEIAALLGRTFHAVHTMRQRLRHEPKYRNVAGMTRKAE